jgi:hypothetical protein
MFVLDVTHASASLTPLHSIESETFDLGGQNVSTITNTIRAAFAEPLPLTGTMIRLTFVTGAGKLGRQKYDADAAKAVTSTLRELGFEEDRGASCVVECAGFFKLQHDTGKNLKTVVVFPKILNEASEEIEAEQQTLLREGSPEHMIATSSMKVFKNMLSSKCPSWSQKKGCSVALEDLRNMICDLDAKLITGTPLDAAEQDFYDTASHLEDKDEHVRTEMHTQVERGEITAWEQETLLSHNADRIATLKKDKSKKGQLDKASQRKTLLTDMVPKEPHKLRHEIAIRKLRKELVPYLQMEEEQKGRLRSVKETQTMARKDEIDEDVAILEEESRGWFEDDDAFQSRVSASRATFATTHKVKGKKAAPSYAGVTRTVAPSKWVLPGDLKKAALASAGALKKKKKNKSKGGDVFSAMMMDDSSDDDDDDDEVPREDNIQARSREQAADITDEPTETTKPTGGGSKKNKKGKKKNKQQKGEDDAALDQAFAQQQAVKKKEQEEVKAQEVAHPALGIVRNYVLPILGAILTWFVTLVFGKPKKRKEKQR